MANWPDDNAAAIVSDRGMYLGYVSAERALLICKRMKESQTVAVFRQCTEAEPTFGSAS
ncbi:hypothetical protein [Sphingomonas sp. BK481]|uniref:hypothetical protein n=1 Tax=Sphingomonas sp. BK481 TaxID=2586981 RepID=UPI00160A08E0|nr:hypothetical protein [Sphingomonas sp. BK481]